MPSAIQKEILASLRVTLRPLIRFLLKAGIGFRELSRICKIAFVQVATEEYGIRGRPTNVSRVAVMTGLTRKEVKAIRDGGELAVLDLWSGKLNPPTEILHHWYSDSDFCDTQGQPLTLSFAGEFPSFTDLMRRYAGDIPPGAMRVELRRSKSIEELPGDQLRPTKNYYTPNEFDDNFVRSMAFSLSNLTKTLVHNADCYQQVRPHVGEGGLFERYVWTSTMSEADVQEFTQLAESKASKMLEELDAWIGEKEQAHRSTNDRRRATAVFEPRVGLGVYMFRNNDSDS